MNTEIIHCGCKRRNKKNNAAMKRHTTGTSDEKKDKTMDKNEEKLDNDNGQAEGEERSGYSER